MKNKMALFGFILFIMVFCIIINFVFPAEKSEYSEIDSQSAFTPIEWKYKIDQSQDDSKGVPEWVLRDAGSSWKSFDEKNKPVDESTEIIWIRARLPEEPLYAPLVVGNVSVKNLEVYVNEKSIYSKGYSDENGLRRDITGRNLIRLPGNYQGKYLYMKLVKPVDFEILADQIKAIAIKSYDQYIKSRIKSQFSYMVFGIILLFLGTIILPIIIFIKKDLLSFLGLSILGTSSGLLFLSETIIADYFGSTTFWYYCGNLLAMLMPAGIFAFCSKFWPQKYKKVAFAQLAFFIIHAAIKVVLDLSGVSMIGSGILIFYIAFGIATVINCVVLIKALNRRTKEIKAIMLGMLIFGLAGINDIFMYYTDYYIPSFSYGLFVFVLSIIASMILSYNEVHGKVVFYSNELEKKNFHLNKAIIEIEKSRDEVNELNKTLEQRVEKRTEELNLMNNELNNALETLQNTQHQLVQSEKMAALGQLISGISHNLKTPIFALSVTLENMKELISEYRDSICDKNVTMEDHYEIAKELANTAESMKPQLSYMSSIITTVKGQIIDWAEGDRFTIDELVSRINILMLPQIKISNCTIDYAVNIDGNTAIEGGINYLIQVICNIINNAIESYANGGEIQLGIEMRDNNILFVIRDHGRGIPESIQKQIFKNMVTNKGKNGTGLGLYISFSSIKSHFGGDMWFESKEGAGTTFCLSIPVNNKVLAK